MRHAPPWLAQLKLLAVYPLPWAGIQVGAAYKNVPGPQMTASYSASDAEIPPSLGRNLSAGANGRATVQLIPARTLYGDGMQELDMDVSEIFNSARRASWQRLTFSTS